MQNCSYLHLKIALILGKLHFISARLNLLLASPETIKKTCFEKNCIELRFVSLCFLRMTAAEHITVHILYGLIFIPVQGVGGFLHTAILLFWVVGHQTITL